jgi:hypothetical protein
MAVTTNNLTQLAAVQRDRWGRYLIPDPHTGEKRAWTRATTVASTLSDKFGLQQWAQRMTARGLVLRPDLFALAAACDPDDKKKLNALVDDAKEAAASSSGANLGTALHSFTEQLDLGQDVHAPAPWDADLAAYQRTLAQAGVRIDSAYVENIVTLPAAGVAGTFDRLVDIDDHLVVADLKTGSFLDWQEISIQLALYAHAETIYDPATNTHTPMPAVDRHRALVIHLPAGKATCELWFVDIAQGWDAAQQALAVREWRTRKNLATQLPSTPRPVVSCDLLGPQTVWLRGRVERIVTALDGRALPAPWPTPTPTFKQGGPVDLEQCDTLGAWCDQVEGVLELPFPDPAPHQAAVRDFTASMSKADVAAIADGRPVSQLTATDVARIVGRNNSNTHQEKESNEQ